MGNSIAFSFTLLLRVLLISFFAFLFQDIAFKKKQKEQQQALKAAKAKMKGGKKK